MCVASPGRVVEINGKTITVDYLGNRVKANSGIVDVKIGDYVLIHAGLVIQVLEKDEAEAMTELFKEIEELGQ